MDGPVKSQTSLFALFKSSPSSSSSLSSSSSSRSCSSSGTAENAFHNSFSPVRTGSKVSHEGGDRCHVAENEANQGTGFRFINDVVVGDGGIMEWKDVEKRFDQLAWTGNGTEPVVTWSEFGFCIGENNRKVNILYNTTTTLFFMIIIITAWW